MHIQVMTNKIVLGCFLFFVTTLLFSTEVFASSFLDADDSSGGGLSASAAESSVLQQQQQQQQRFQKQLQHRQLMRQVSARRPDSDSNQRRRPMTDDYAPDSLYGMANAPKKLDLTPSLADYLYEDMELQNDNDADQLQQPQKRQSLISVFRRGCVPRGGNCDHRPFDCCFNSSCRCNLWGTNCRCQRMGLFQKWG